MPIEKSAGAVIFRKQRGGIYYLLLHYGIGHWDLAKGHIEKEETETETVKREVREETGLGDINIIYGFKERIKYYFTAKEKTIFKTVVFYLAETKTKSVKISKEHIGFKWLPYNEALKQLTFQKPRGILKKADKFIDGG